MEYDKPIEEFCNSTFWDEDLTWNTNDPDFTPCFQKTVLVYVPCGFLWLFGILHCIGLFKVLNVGSVPFSILNISKSVVCVGLIAITAADLITILDLPNPPGADVLLSSLLLATFVFALIIIQLDRWRGQTATVVLFFFWLILMLCGTITVRSASRALINTDLKADTRMKLFFAYYPLVCIQWLLTCFSDKVPPGSVYASKKSCPEGRTSALGKIIFSWMDPLMWKGFKNPLVKEDLWELGTKDKSSYIVTKFEDHMGETLETSFSSVLDTKPIDSLPKKEEPLFSLYSPIVKRFGSVALKGFFVRVCYDLLIFVNPQILGLILDFLQSEDEDWKGIMYACMMFVMAVTLTLLQAQYYHIMMTGGMRLRAAIIATVYKKALIMNNASRKDSTVGEIVNLMSVDAQRLLDVFTYLAMCVSCPIQIGLALYFLYNELGVAVFTGVGIMVVMIPAQFVVSAKQRGKQVDMMKIKDERSKMMNEVLNGIKVLKLYAWEPSFEKIIKNIRDKEIVLIKDVAILQSISIVLMTCAPFFVAFGSFTTYVLIDDENWLLPDVTFVSLNLLSILSFSLNIFPMLLTMIVQAMVSIKRLNHYFAYANIKTLNVTHVESKNAVEVENATFSWAPEDPVVLNNLDFKVKKGSLVGVVGAVGSGKSSLVHALLGELQKINGSVNVHGNVSYVPQQAWIMNATVRENILFGKLYDPEWYEKVVEACALKPDFQILEGGDMTEIGEKGINLSGGQKQRISLARAVYADGDIYYLDDPLSAVDAHVGEHLFNKVIGPKGLLRGKTRILVTHALAFLPQVEEILVIDNERISESGTFRQLIDNKQAFSELLSDYVQEDERDIGSRRMSVGTSTFSHFSVFSRSLGKEEKASALERSVSIVETDDTDFLSALNEEKDKKQEKAGQLIEVEKVETGGISWQTMVYYCECIGYWTLSIILLGYIGSYAFKVGADMYLTSWTEAYDVVAPGEYYMSDEERNRYIGFYGALGFGQVLFMFFGDFVRALGMMVAGRVIHENLLTNAFHCPMSFFDTTPLGRILNRFSKDMDVIDTNLPQSIRMILWTSSSILGTLFTIIYATPEFAIIIVPLGLVFGFMQRFYVATSNQLRRLESVTRSPIYSLFSETLSGVTSIRAYDQVGRFTDKSLQMIDENTKCYFPFVAANRWLAVRLETLGNLVVFFAALFAVLSRGSLSAGLAGLSITYSQSITAMLNWLVRMSAEAETNVVAVERILEYTNVDNEAEWDRPENQPPQEWPDKGDIVFNNYATRYREGLDLVLKGITCHIKPGEKVGIVGRTGAGKSSLTLALFRIIEPAGGSIVIDGYDIFQIGLHALRSKLTIIPQDPVLFSGSLRMNLDPFDQFSDADVWHVLELAHLKDYAKGLEAGLQHTIAEGGENLSVGQRQLVCLARALLRKTKVLILDEATAAVDVETDQLIQKTIRAQFSDCSILTIAHRLNTILDYDKVMVLDKGMVDEFDSPPNLLEDTKSTFHSMAKAANLV